MQKNPDELNKGQGDLPPANHPVGPIVDADIYQRLVKEVRDYAIFMLDQKGFIQTWNAGAERLKGYTPEEIVGRHFSCFYPAEDIRAERFKRTDSTSARSNVILIFGLDQFFISRTSF